jgi:hypothetical protein
MSQSPRSFRLNDQQVRGLESLQRGHQRECQANSWAAEWSAT